MTHTNPPIVPRPVAAAEASERSATENPIFSPSRLQLLQSCSANYKAKYIDGLPEPQSAAASIGVMTHLILANAAAAIQMGEDPTNVVLGTIGEMTKVESHKKVAQAVMALQDIADIYGPSIQAFVDTGTTLLMEEDLSADYGPVTIRGIADVVALGQDRTTIIDYKTGKLPKQSPKATIAAQTYLAIAHARWGLPTVGVWVYRSKLLAFNEPKGNPFEQYIEGHEKLKRLFASGDWEPTVHAFCASCPLAAECETYSEHKQSKAR